MPFASCLPRSKTEGKRRAVAMGCCPSRVGVPKENAEKLIQGRFDPSAQELKSACSEKDSEFVASVLIKVRDDTGRTQQQVAPALGTAQPVCHAVGKRAHPMRDARGSSLAKTPLPHLKGKLKIPLPRIMDKTRIIKT